jgi:DNA-binding transcriptional LysR family regulator
MHHVDFAREDIDLAIRHGGGNWVGLDAVNLCAEKLFSVCSPALLGSQRGIHSPEDALQFPLLHLNDRRDWSRWLEAAGASGEGLLHGPIPNHASMLIDAAIDGQGIALARTALAVADLINGRLVRPFQTTLALKNTLLDRVPQGDFGISKDRRVPWLAPGGGSGGCEAARRNWEHTRVGSRREPSACGVGTDGGM